MKVLVGILVLVVLVSGCTQSDTGLNQSDGKSVSGLDGNDKPGTKPGYSDLGEVILFEEKEAVVTFTWPGKEFISEKEADIFILNIGNQQLEITDYSFDFSVDGKVVDIVSITRNTFPSRGSWDAVDVADGENMILKPGEKGKIHYHAEAAPGTQKVNIGMVFIVGGKSFRVNKTLERERSSEDFNESGHEGGAPKNETQLDKCGNDLGNGNEIISGPSGPSKDMADRDNPFRSLTVHPANPDVVYLGTERNGFLKSDDGGLTWKRMRKGLRHSPEGYPEVYDIGIAGSNPLVLYSSTVGSPGPLSGEFGGDEGIYKSVDGGETWFRKNCGINNARVTTIWVSPTDPDWAIASPAGGYPSFTGRNGIENQFFEGGLYLTTDGGDNWVRTSDFQGHEQNAYSVIVSARDNPSLVYSFGSLYVDENKKGGAGEGAGFVKSLDGGKTWKQFAPELKGKSVGPFAISKDGSAIYAVIDMDMHRSLDGGKTWTVYQIRSSGYSVAVFPSDPKKVIFSKWDGLYLSRDGMETDVKVLEHDSGLYDLVIAPSDESIIYAVALEYIVYKSVDGGSNWKELGNLRKEVLNA